MALLAACEARPVAPPSAAAPPPAAVAGEPVPAARAQGEAAVVQEVADGDSVRLADGRRLRYLEVDCPEQDEPLAEEARSRNRELVEGRPVRLEFGPERQDRFERLLAWVYVDGPDGREVLVNEVLVLEGLARYYPHGEATPREAPLRAAQERAREARRGVWGLPAPSPAPYYVGTRNRFHRPDCPDLGGLPEARRTRLATREEALDSGRSPCRGCKP